MSIAFVSVENDITSIGFRRMASLVRMIQPNLDVYYVVPIRTASPLKRLTGTTSPYSAAEELEEIASHLAKSNVICFSCMSTHAEYTKKLIRAIRTRNSNSFIVWGGTHCIVDPEDAIRHADAVCIGEGEKALPEFLFSFTEGKDYTGIGNWYFRKNGKIIRNGLIPLLTNQELEDLPFPLYGDNELIYKPNAGFVVMDQRDYVRFEGLQYNTLWSIGCPNRCIYCGNSRFLKNHKEYARLRHPSVDYIVEEVKRALLRHPHLSSVTFHDDSFMAIPREVLEDFALKWRNEVGLPFAVHGLIPRYVHPEKMKILISAGMIRIRMGIQSGSERTLKFFRRPETIGTMTRALSVINDYSKYMMPPSYDLIVDNPWETPEDTAATVRLIYDLQRPFILNIFPLMVVPGTELQEIAERQKVDLPYITHMGPGKLSPSLANLLLVGLVLVRLPKRFMEKLLKRMTNSNLSASTYPLLLRLIESLAVIKKALLHIRFGNLSVIPNTLNLFLLKVGIVSFLNKRMLKKCASVDGASAFQKYNVDK